MIAPDTVVFATDASDEGKADARAWCRLQGFGSDDVRIVLRGDKQCLVIAKRGISPKAVSLASV